MIRAYELGVLFVPQQGQILLAGDVPKVEQQTITLPIPFQLPCKQYDKADLPFVSDE